MLMRLNARNTVRSAASLVLLGAAMQARANDLDPALATAPDAPVTAQPATPKHFFRSWFGGLGQHDEATFASTASLPAVADESASSSAVAGDLVTNALGLLGVMYRRGGNTPDSGFDCSGMVRYVFQNAAGLDLPRRAAEISRLGAKVDRHDLQPGDLVFYNTLKKAFSHVGIYLGDGRFIHAPSRGSSVRIDDMTQSYWAARFNGARRVTN